MLAAFAAAAASAAEGDSGLPQLNIPDFAPQLAWLALTFVLLYLVLSRLALPRIGEVIEERRDRIQRDLDEAERLRAETAKAIQTYEQALAEARARAQGIARETRERLAGEVGKERAKVEALITEKSTKAEQQIAAAKAKALASVGEVAADTTGAIVAKLIGTEPGRAEVLDALAKSGRSGA